MRTTKQSGVRAAVMCSVIVLSAPVGAVDIMLFGDINIEDGDREEDKGTFKLGKLDLLINQDVDEKTKVNAELIFADVGHGIETEVERFAVTYQLKDSLSIGAGRYHTPLGFWNFNFHHGMLVQDSITRPFFLEFENMHEGVFPTHVVGMLVSGLVAREQSELTYQLAVGNSPSLDTAAEQSGHEVELQVNNFQDLTDKKTVVGHIQYAPIDGKYKIGVSAMRNNIAESGEFNADPRLAPYLPTGEILFVQKVLGVDAQYSNERFHAIAEYFQIDIKDNAAFNAARAVANPIEYASVAYYAQLGWNLSDRMTFAIRYESLEYEDNATYYSVLNIAEQKSTIYALRYNLSDSNVLRFQISNHEIAGELSRVYAMQWFFMVL